MTIRAQYKLYAIPSSGLSSFRADCCQCEKKGHLHDAGHDGVMLKVDTYGKSIILFCPLLDICTCHGLQEALQAITG